MADVLQVAGTEELALGHFKRAAVLAVILTSSHEEKIGCRAQHIADETGLQPSAVQSIVNDLEVLGLIASKAMQVGTAGTTDRFYMPTQGANVKILGSPALKSSVRGY